MRALVTGGTGFIGSHVVDLLVENGHEVTVFTRKKELPPRWAVRAAVCATGDLNDPDALLAVMRDQEVLFHVGEVKVTTRTAAQKNIRLLERIITHLGPTKIRRLVFISSITVAGVPKTVPAAEDTPAELVLNDHYTAYKRECEERITKDPTADYVIIRPGVVYGPRSRSLRAMSAVLARTGAVGIPFIGGAGNLLPLVHVRDLARAIYRAGIMSVAGRQTFNLTDGERHTWNDFFGAIASNAGKKPRIIPFPAWLLRWPALFGDVLAGLFGVSADLPSYLAYLTHDVHFTMVKAEQILGWRALNTDLLAGVKEMMAWQGDA